ncbi:MAG: efflux RND transporter periplasmic adaptor subunit [Bacteroides sp.]|nr:efflux RND transporter periplasmic adaptor subunit [Bacteroides sp.]
MGIIAWFIWGRTPKHKVTYVTTPVNRNTISNSITATGTVEPITQVEVGTQVSGIIDKIYVDFNSEVKKGQVIAELDKTNLLNELASQKNSVESARVAYEYQLSNYNRYKTLFEKQLVSSYDYETAYYEFQRAKNTYESSQNDLAKAQTNLGYATIYSPIDGVVLSRDVEEGQTVAASFSTPTLFTIADDLTQMQVVADVDEADIGGVREGQNITFTVDAYPEDTFRGHVTRVRQEATTTNNVVTYEVVINAPNPDLKLKPGLTANVNIYILEMNDVLSVPSKALRFVPEKPLIGDDDVIMDVNAPHKVWTREEKTFRAHAVETGITNGSLTEIKGGVEEGTQVITDAVIGTMPGDQMRENGNGQQETNNPFMPSPPGSRRR